MSIKEEITSVFIYSKLFVMNKLITFFATLMFFCQDINCQEYIQMIESGTNTIQEIQKSAESYFANRDKGKGSGYKQYKRWEYNALRMMDENGSLKSDQHYINEWEKLNARTNQAANVHSRNNDFWTELGPDYYNSTTSWNPGVGRITSFHIDGNNEKHIIVGAETGGVWKTTDGALTWKPMTDFFTNIAVESVIISHQNANIYYFGSNNGKIYQSKNGGNTWQELATIGGSKVRKLSIHPDNANIMYACVQNSGFYKSINAGAIWTKITDDNNGYDIQYKPNDPNTIYLAGSFFYVSVDGGSTFRKVYDGQGYPDLVTITSPASLAKPLNAVDNNFQPGYVSVPTYPSSVNGKLVLYKDMGNPNSMEACGNAENPAEIQGNIAVVVRGNCVFVNKVLNAQKLGAKAVIVINNVDGSPTAMGGGDGNISIPAFMISKAEGEKLVSDMLSHEITLTLQKSLIPENSMRISPKMIGVSKSQPNTVYVLEANKNVFGGLYKSTNAGSSFVKLNHTGRNYFGYSTMADDDRGQAPRNMAIAVNPDDANEVHIGGILTFMSTDGGMSFEPTSDWVPYRAAADGIGYCHADICMMSFYNKKLYVSSDGGLFRSNTSTQDVSEDFYEDISDGLGIRQFYKIGVSQTIPVTITGGSQDNGSSWFTDEFGWQDWLGADGMEGFVDKDNRYVLYGTTQNGGLYSKDQFDFITYIDRPENKVGSWVTPFDQDHNVSNTIYAGYNVVYKSQDQGETWVPISQVFGQNLNHLKISKNDSRVMYAAFGSNLFKTISGGGNWSSISGFEGSINEIAIHPQNDRTIAIATTGSQKIYVSYDGGDTWISFRKNLPDFAALSLVWEDSNEGGLYVGMNFGVFYINNTLQNWIPFLNNLPNVIVNELEINYKEKKLYAATYGRGLWETPLYDKSSGIDPLAASSQLTVQPNPSNAFINISSSILNLSEISIFDAGGKLMFFQKDIVPDQVSINLIDYPSGIYFLKIADKDGVHTRKFVKS